MRTLYKVIFKQPDGTWAENARTENKTQAHDILKTQEELYDQAEMKIVEEPLGQ